MYIFGGWNGFDTLNELYMYSVGKIYIYLYDF